MSPNLPPTLPLHLDDAPEWERDLEDVTIVTKFGPVRCRALADNDVLVNAELTYRGNEYRVRYEHTTDAGDFYVYAANGNDREVAGETHFRLSSVLGGAPRTYIGPLRETIRGAVVTYLTEHAAHAEENRRRNYQQDAHRQADEYNRRAAELAAILARYNAAMERAGI